MERAPNRIAQLYGYSVCLIAVVVFIFSLQSAVEGLFTLSNPLQSPYAFGEGSLTSFEAYKATYGNIQEGFVTQGFVNQNAISASRPATKLSDSELRARYEALRADRINSAIYMAKQNIVVSSIMMLVAIVLFAVHWQWLRTTGVSVHT